MVSRLDGEVGREHLSAAYRGIAPVWTAGGIQIDQVGGEGPGVDHRRDQAARLTTRPGLPARIVQALVVDQLHGERLTIEHLPVGGRTTSCTRRVTYKDAVPDGDP